MRMATVREFRNAMSSLMSESEPVLVTRNGKPAGFFVPWDDKTDLPLEIKKEMFSRITPELKAKFEAIDEEEMLKDFAEWRKNH